jgi:hypothetical protein
VVLKTETSEQVDKNEFGNAGQGVVITGGNRWGEIAHDNLQVYNAPIEADGKAGVEVANMLGRNGGWEEDEKAAMQSNGSERGFVWYGWALGGGWPAFSGNRVFFRTFGHLYCIANRTEPFRPSEALKGGKK